MHVFTKNVIVQLHQIDDLQHLNNIEYLIWVQQVSKEHWQMKSTSEMNKKYFWVVRSHQIEYKKPGFLEDKLTIKTFVDNWKGPFSERNVTFYRNDTLLAKAVSKWCLIERITNRVTDIPLKIYDRFANDE